MGLSGGVDSAVSAALLQQQGYDVTGVFIRIALPGYPCSAGEDKISAQRVAAHLGIPFIEIDLSKEYEQEVFAYTLAELSRGRTPNPDTMCNQKIKFGAFYAWARARGAQMVATGHYAQSAPASSNVSGYGIFSAKKIPEVLGSSTSKPPPTLLLAGADPEKDQSYFLWMVPQDVLQYTFFPVGHLHKPQVRELAKKFGLPNAARKDSQGLCFLGSTSISDMIERELSPKPGNVLNEAGEVVGTHSGVALYTEGQRHGFELLAQNPHSEPYFVIAKDIHTNTITVSHERFPTHATKTHVELVDTNWIGSLKPGSYMARFRYRQTLIPAHLEVKNNTPTVTLLEPHYIPSGQSLVLYMNERCLGGGIVDNSTLL